MQATAIQNQPVSGKNGFEKKPRLVTWTEFKRKYLHREDGYKYEWVRGEIIKTKWTMNKHQYHILRNLREFFTQLKQENKVGGGFEPEMEIWFLPENFRRPDLVYYSPKQEAYLANEIEQIPQFVIEVISNNDQLNQLEDKMGDYEAAGVQVIWLIFPNQQTVHVYQGKRMVKCKSNDICSAAPVLPAFALKASDIFKRPALPEE